MVLEQNWTTAWSVLVFVGYLTARLVFWPRAMLPCLGSAELGRGTWDPLLAAKTEPEARLCKVALVALADAEIQCAFTNIEVAE